MTTGRILIADDEDALRTALRSVLTNAGYEVIEASNGVEALKLCRARPPNLAHWSSYSTASARAG